MIAEHILTIADIQKQLARLPDIECAAQDVKAMLEHNGKSQLRFLVDVITAQYRRTYTHTEVPSSLLWEPATLKAYDCFIPLCENWLNSLQQERAALAGRIEG